MTADELYGDGALDKLKELTEADTIEEQEIPEGIPLTPPPKEGVRVHVEWEDGRMDMDMWPKIVHFDALYMDEPGTGKLSYLCTYLPSQFYEWGIENIQCLAYDANANNIFKQVGFTGTATHLVAPTRPDAPMRLYGAWKRGEIEEPDWHRWFIWA